MWSRQRKSDARDRIKLVARGREQAKTAETLADTVSAAGANGGREGRRPRSALLDVQSAEASYFLSLVWSTVDGFNLL